MVMGMRIVFGCLAVGLCAVSVALAARYGFKSADTFTDAAIGAIVFGAIALCACLFDGAAVRLWFTRHYVGAVIIGTIAVAALVVTFTNSLGAIAGRSDLMLAERETAKATAASLRSDLSRTQRERGEMRFTPTTAEAVGAAREAVGAAERIRAAECDKRGPNCRLRESEEQAKRDALTAALTSKAQTDRAAALDAAAAALLQRIETAPQVANPNPLGATLELILGHAASALTAWQQAIIAGVFELCLVGVMVIYELLGHPKPVPVAPPALEGVPVELDDIPRPAIRKRPPPAPGSVVDFLADVIEGEDGSTVEVSSLYATYKSWCRDNSRGVLDGQRFVDDFKAVSRKVGIEIEKRDGKVVCLDVRLAA